MNFISWLWVRFYNGFMRHFIHIAVGGPTGPTPDGGKTLMFRTQPVK